MSKLLICDSNSSFAQWSCSSWAAQKMSFSTFFTKSVFCWAKITGWQKWGTNYILITNYPNTATMAWVQKYWCFDRDTQEIDDRTCEMKSDVSDTNRNYRQWHWSSYGKIRTYILPDKPFWLPKTQKKLRMQNTAAQSQQWPIRIIGWSLLKFPTDENVHVCIAKFRLWAVVPCGLHPLCSQLAHRYDEQSILAYDREDRCRRTPELKLIEGVLSAWRRQQTE